MSDLVLVRTPLPATDDRGTGYRFRHAWIGEVAYAQLLRWERTELRAAVGA